MCVGTPWSLYSTGPMATLRPSVWGHLSAHTATLEPFQPTGCRPQGTDSQPPTCSNKSYFPSPIRSAFNNPCLTAALAHMVAVVTSPYHERRASGTSLGDEPRSWAHASHPVTVLPPSACRPPQFGSCPMATLTQPPHGVSIPHHPHCMVLLGIPQPPHGVILTAWCS